MALAVRACAYVDENGGVCTRAVGRIPYNFACASHVPKNCLLIPARTEDRCRACDQQMINIDWMCPHCSAPYHKSCYEKYFIHKRATSPVCCRVCGKNFEVDEDAETLFNQKINYAMAYPRAMSDIQKHIDQTLGRMRADLNEAYNNDKYAIKAYEARRMRELCEEIMKMNTIAGEKHLTRLTELHDGHSEASDNIKKIYDLARAPACNTGGEVSSERNDLFAANPVLLRALNEMCWETYKRDRIILEGGGSRGRYRLGPLKGIKRANDAA